MKVGGKQHKRGSPAEAVAGKNGAARALDGRVAKAMEETDGVFCRDGRKRRGRKRRELKKSGADRKETGAGRPTATGTVRGKGWGIGARAAGKRKKRRVLVKIQRVDKRVTRLADTRDDGKAGAVWRPGKRDVVLADVERQGVNNVALAPAVKRKNNKVCDAMIRVGDHAVVERRGINTANRNVSKMGKFVGAVAVNNGKRLDTAVYGS